MSSSRILNPSPLDSSFQACKHVKLFLACRPCKTDNGHTWAAQQSLLTSAGPAGWLELGRQWRSVKVSLNYSPDQAAKSQRTCTSLKKARKTGAGARGPPPGTERPSGLARPKEARWKVKVKCPNPTTPCFGAALSLARGGALSLVEGRREQLPLTTRHRTVWVAGGRALMPRSCLTCPGPG